jgi:FixJ family two-component response regulator
MTFEGPFAYVIDADPQACDAVIELLAQQQMRVIAFTSIAHYLAFERPSHDACLIVEAQLPNGAAWHLQSKLAGTDHPPIVFTGAQADVASTVRVLKDGAVDFLIKPYREQDLLDAVNAAVALDRVARVERAEHTQLKARFLSLTPREREVVPLIVGGLLNRQAAVVLGISKVTLQIHRRHVMRKMSARTLPDLVRMADRLGLVPVEPECSAADDAPEEDLAHALPREDVQQRV